jgi:branched-chain amino acid transport system substrate-binding protein
MRGRSFILIMGFLLFGLSCERKQQKAIEIAAMMPLTGPLAEFGNPLRDGMLMAEEEINSDPQSKKIQVIAEDDLGDPKNAVTIFTKFCDVDRVPLVLGPATSGASMATAPIAEQNRVVQISTIAGIPQLSDAGDYVFRLYPSSALGARYVVQQATSRFKAKNIAVLYANNPFGQTTRVIVEQGSNEYGYAIVAVETFKDGDRDFRAQLTKIKSARPDVLVCNAYYVEGAQILRQAKQLGLEIPVLGEDGWFGPIAHIAREALKNLYFANVAFGAEEKDNAKMQSFISAFEKRYGRKPNTYSAVGYDGVHIAKRLIDKYASNSQEIKTALYRLDYSGAFGRIRFDSKGDNIAAVYRLYQLNERNEPVLVK